MTTTTEEGRAALVAALAEITEPACDAVGTAGGSSRYAYVTLSGLLTHVRPILARQGLGLVHSTECRVTEADGSGEAEARAQIVHACGTVAESCATMPVRPAVRKDGTIVAPGAREYGIALTYARRYASYGCLGVGGETDSDGGAIREAEAASHTQQQKPASTPARNAAGAPAAPLGSLPTAGATGPTAVGQVAQTVVAQMQAAAKPTIRNPSAKATEKQLGAIVAASNAVAGTEEGGHDLRGRWLDHLGVLRADLTMGQASQILDALKSGHPEPPASDTNEQQGEPLPEIKDDDIPF